MCGDVGFQSVLDHGGVGGEGSSQRINQHIGLIVILGGIQSIRIGVAVLAICQIQCLQEIRALGLVDGIQNLYMAVGAAVHFGLGEGHNIRDLEESELHALDSIAVAGFTVAQSGTAAAQHIVDAGLVKHTGGHIGRIPNAVLFGVGQIVLVDGQGAGPGFVDGSVLQLGSGNGNREAQQQSQRQNEGQNFGKVFHFAFSFLNQNSLL